MKKFCGNFFTQKNFFLEYSIFDLRITWVGFSLIAYVCTKQFVYVSHKRKSSRCKSRNRRTKRYNYRSVQYIFFNLSFLNGFYLKSKLNSKFLSLIRLVRLLFNLYYNAVKSQSYQVRHVGVHHRCPARAHPYRPHPGATSFVTLHSSEQSTDR
jgi:hypothetical protein